MKAFRRILTVLFIVSIFISGGRAQASIWNLNKALAQSAGKLTASIVKADFNGDGIMDLVSCSRQNPGKVSVFLGKGDGKFKKKVTFTTGKRPVSMVTGDFDGDGFMDLAVVNWGDDVVGDTPPTNPGSVIVYLGKGDGTFKTSIEDPNSEASYTTGINPVYIVSGDFTGTGKTDLAVANWGSDNVSVLRHSSPPGKFDNSTSVFKPIPVGVHPRSIATGIVGNDTKVDLVVANWSSDTVSLLHGDGAGNFATPTITDTFNVGKNPASVALGDLNGDGYLDIVTANFDSENVSILLSDSSGSVFNGFKPVEFLPVGNGPSFVQIKDIDGDGNQDILTCNGTMNNMSLLLGFGDGTFQVKKDFAVGSDPVAAVLSDFNNNGGWDLAVANFNTGSISVFTDKNTKLGDWNFIPGLNTTTAATPISVFATDLNRDEFNDVVTADGSNVEVLLNDGKGGLGTAAVYPAGMTPVDAVVADFTGDGIKDIAVANNDSLDVTILRGAPDGTYSAIVPSVSIGHSPVSIVNADFNKDGKMDFAACNSGTPGSVYVFTGNGDGTFTSPTSPLSIDVGENPMKIVTGDFNGDGRPDLAVANQDSDSITILMGVLGGGFIKTTITLPLGTAPKSLAAADFNADNKTDLAVLSAAHKTVFILLSNGNGTFRGLAGVLSTGDSPSSIAAADLNLDKMPDIVVTAADGVSVYFGKGSGVFNTASLIDSTTGSISAVISEFNKDGKADLAVASSAPGVYIIKGIDQFNINTGTTGSGTVSPASGFYEAGKNILFKATPNTDNYFVRWSGDMSGTENPRALLINSSVKDKTITANFETGPYISSFSTNQGVLKDTITISGSNFGSAKGTVTLGSANVAINDWSVTGDSISFTVPTNLVYNKYKLHVTTSDNKKSNDVDFYILKAFITGITNDTLVTITSAVKGQTVIINGANFGPDKVAVTIYPIDGITRTNAAVTSFVTPFTSVTFTVPGVTAGDYIIKLKNAHGYSNGWPITIN